MTQNPTVAITIGDPCGIGPEVVAKAITQPEIRELCIPVIVGNANIMNDALAMVKPSLNIEEIIDISYITPSHETLYIIDPHNLNRDEITPGVVSAAAGKASMEWVELAARLCLNGHAQAMATAPLNKEASAAAGYQEIGHMELLQSLTNSPQVATMLMSGTLRVVHLTTHRSLRQACDAITRDNILIKLKLTHDSFQEWGFPKPRIGVAALNPHGSDGGLLGMEESIAIEPAIMDAQAAGVNAIGPIPADSVFNQAISGKYDVVLCMYHDQGHIPVKIHGFEESVSVNLGLPLVRTSVDHGTAFDIAGKGVAQAISMLEAIKLAAGLAAGHGLPR
ncbi:4-hydroxythreonine-4-phosphate dehydrogenase PdxA [Dehalococcoidia bacterium]|nr:4-hydroxythreonine-4-phosphate dehydrogenase PdxA [Dehalococcoidia bacterium]